MKKLGIVTILIFCLTVTVAAQSGDDSVTSGLPKTAGILEGIRSAIVKHLGRPYVWGASGMKSFDCSGFIWRVMYENGILLKRTTARKFYMLLPPVPQDQQWDFGTLVFFDNLKHVGIVDNKEAFYHAQVTLGTNRSPMNSFWKRKIYGFRKLPVLSEPQ